MGNAIGRQAHNATSIRADVAILHQLYGVNSAVQRLLSLLCSLDSLDYSVHQRLVLKLKQTITFAEKQAGGRLCFPFL